MVLRRILAVLATLVLIVLSPVGAPRAAAMTPLDDGILCQNATADAEAGSGVPNQLLNAISRVESGRYDETTGGVRGWPWTINAQGRGHFYASKQEAVAAARAFQAAGIDSIDVGCMQINLKFHPEGFASLEQAFDPRANAAYAARFLTDLFHQTGSWPHAAAAYHSQTPDLGIDYQRKVLEAWAEPIDGPAGPTSHHPDSPAPHPAPLLAGLAPRATVGASPVTVASMGRPLGGFGHIIREGGISGGSLSGFAGRTLAAYRAMPVRVAFLPGRNLPD